MKVAMDLFFTEDFRKALGQRLGMSGLASRDTIRAWAKAVLFAASKDVLEHPEGTEVPARMTAEEVAAEAEKIAKAVVEG